MQTVLLLAVAILPAIGILIYVYTQDRIEKEPTGLIVKLIFSGLISIILSIILETLGSIVSDGIDFRSEVTSVGFYYFLVVALAEEGTKFLCLYWFTWKKPSFDYKFDAIIYSVSASIGFALFENIGYVLTRGLTTGLLRAVTSIPGHTAFAIIMGVYYGRAKEYSNKGDKKKCKQNIALGVLLAIVAHGLYDSIAMIVEDANFWLFLLFIIVLFVVCFITLKRESKNDHKIAVDNNIFNKII